MFLRWIPDRSSSSLSPVLCYPRADPPWTCWRVSSLAESVLRPSLHSLRYLLNAASHTFFQLLLMFFPTAVSVGGSSLQKLKFFLFACYRFPRHLLTFFSFLCWLFFSFTCWRFSPSLVDFFRFTRWRYPASSVDVPPLRLLTLFSFCCRHFPFSCWRFPRTSVDVLSLLLLRFFIFTYWRLPQSFDDIFPLHLMTSSPFTWWHFPPSLDDVFSFTYWSIPLDLLTFFNLSRWRSPPSLVDIFGHPCRRSSQLWSHFTFTCWRSFLRLVVLSVSPVRLPLRHLLTIFSFTCWYSSLLPTYPSPSFPLNRLSVEPVFHSVPIPRSVFNHFTGSQRGLYGHVIQ